jgi:GT2 family glycosyltransferase
MSPRSTPKVVVLGMMTKMPVAGVVWQTIHYLLGLDLLGFETFYVEAHARTPAMLMRTDADDSSAIAASFISSVMHRFGFDRRWAFQALHADGRCYGLSRQELSRLYRDAALIFNLHGGTEPTDELCETGRLVYIETDPGRLQVELAEKREQTIRFLDRHCAHFSFAENWGNPDCLLPSTDLFRFRATRQPVVMSLWETALSAGSSYTTIANWDQQGRDIVFGGETYRWNKRDEFLKVIDLPSRSGDSFELALSGCSTDDEAMLRRHGWTPAAGLEISASIDRYRSYIRGSRGEFTAAKDQNVRLRSGWFSDRSATYLAAGRPVITQYTGFGNVLPTGEGLFEYTSTDDILDALTRIEADYGRHARAAGGIASEFFSHEAVLSPMVESLDIRPDVRRGARRREIGHLDICTSETLLHPGLLLDPERRNPLVLAPATVAHTMSAPLPPAHAGDAGSPVASIVVVTFGSLVFTRLCLESILANTEEPSFELIVVDNSCSQETLEYLADLERLDARVVVLPQHENVGFPRAVNIGLRAGRGEALVILNNDTIVTPGWLAGLLSHLIEPSTGLVGPVTNQCDGECRVRARYRTYGEMLSFSSQRARDGKDRPVATLTMFCVALRRGVYESVGPLDELFGTGLFEDDDYAVRLRTAGYSSICAEDVFVHHFGSASIGDLVPAGEYMNLFNRNRAYFERKWWTEWVPRPSRDDPEYDSRREELAMSLRSLIPEGSTVAVATRGDDRLLAIPGRTMWHFPRHPSGEYAGYYPSDGDEAITWVKTLRTDGCTHIVFPIEAAWWLHHYRALDRYLCEEATLCSGASDGCAIFELSAPDDPRPDVGEPAPRQELSYAREGGPRW